jgi:hypothetical protein
MASSCSPSTCKAQAGWSWVLGYIVRPSLKNKTIQINGKNLVWAQLAIKVSLLIDSFNKYLHNIPLGPGDTEMGEGDPQIPAIWYLYSMGKGKWLEKLNIF